jgi:hypothetical protein
MPVLPTRDGARLPAGLSCCASSHRLHGTVLVELKLGVDVFWLQVERDL